MVFRKISIILCLFLILIGVNSFVLHVSAAGPHDYFNTLVAKPEKTLAWSLRNPSQLVDRTYVTYDPFNDLYSDKQDAAKVVIATNSVSLQTQVRLPLDISSGVHLVTWDSWWGPEYITDRGPINTHKAFQFSHSGNDTLWFEVRSSFSRATPGNVAAVNFRSYNSPGPNMTDQDPVAPQLNQFMIAPSTWTRYWVEMDYDSAPGRVVVSVWMADENRDPIQLIDKLNFSDSKILKKFWIEFNTSQYGRTGGELVAYVRNVVVLSGLSNPTTILEKPIGGDFVMPSDVQPNSIPSVNMTSPTNNQTFFVGDSVVLGATASDQDGSISKVEFYQGTTLLNSDSASPYSYSWSNLLAGSYVLTAKAYDNAGASSVSQVITVLVSTNSTTTPPVTPPQDTTPPTISGVSVSSITTSGATIIWTTNESSTASIQYGLTTAYGSTLNSAGTTSHTVTLTGLQPNTVYNYHITAKDTANNTTTITNQTFTTIAANQTTPPPTTPVTPPVTPPSSGGGVAPITTPGPTPTTPAPSSGGVPTVTTGITVTPTQPQTPTATVKGPNITRTLTVGSKGGDVAELQTYLKALGYLPTGRADGNFGFLTRDAVQKYQCATLQICSGSTTTNGYGLVGSKTRATLLGIPLETTVSSKPVSNGTGQIKLTRTLSFGMRNTDVSTLQTFLISKGYLTQGNATGYFGNLTRQAVQRFQCDKISICSGSSTTNGYGVVGPKTRVEMGR